MVVVSRVMFPKESCGLGRSNVPWTQSVGESRKGQGVCENECLAGHPERICYGPFVDWGGLHPECFVHKELSQGLNCPWSSAEAGPGVLACPGLCRGKSREAPMVELT